MSDITVRVATPDDAAALLDLYAPYVRETAISFETVVPSEDEFRRRIIHTLQRYPYLIAEAEGHILGYAYTSPVRRGAPPTTGARKRPSMLI